MTPEEIEALVGGYHGDPFRILGPTPSANAADSRVGRSARSCLKPNPPRCGSATRSTPWRRPTSGGFFCATLAGTPGKYLIQAKLWDGATHRIRRSLPFRPAHHRFRAPPAYRRHALRGLSHAGRARRRSRRRARRAFRRLGAQRRKRHGSRRVQPVGIRAAILCAAATAACGSFSSPGWAKARLTSIMSARVSRPISS